MVLRIATLLLITILSVSVTSIDGSVVVTSGDIKRFDFFWSPDLKHVRDECEYPPGNFLRTIQYAIDTSEDCQAVLDRWKYFNSLQLIRYPQKFQSACSNIFVAAGNCWLRIIKVLQTCYKPFVQLDHYRFHLFPKFLGSLCIYNTTGFFVKIHEPTDSCIRVMTRELKRNALEAGVNINDTYRESNCWAAKAAFQCGYASTDTPDDLFAVYQVADTTMDKIFHCDEVAAVNEGMEGIQKAIRDRDIPSE